MIGDLNQGKNNIEDIANYIIKIKDVDKGIIVKSFHEYLDIIRACDLIHGQKLYRGQADIDWDIVSGAYRCIRSNQNNVSLKRIKEYITNLLKRIRKIKDDRISSDTTDLNLLAEIQHHGGKTILIDFSYSPLVALFFACKDTSISTVNKDSAVYMIFNDNITVQRRSKICDFTIENIPDESTDVSNLFIDNENTYMWQPPNQNRRILVQQSVFIINTLGKIRKSNTLQIIIPSELKKEIITYLSALGIKGEFLFADFLGVLEWYKDSNESDKLEIKKLYEEATEYFKEKKYERALHSYSQIEESLKNEISKANTNVNHISIANIYCNIAETYRAIEDYVKASDYYEKALNISIDILGKKHPDTLYAYDNVGVTCMERGEYNAAILNFNDALGARIEKLGENHVDVAATRNNIGRGYYEVGNYEYALIECENALRIRRMSLSENHADMASSYNNLGLIYSKKKNYDEALELYFKALKIRKNCYGDEHRITATTLSNIANVYYNMEEYDKALEYYFDSYIVMKKLFGEKHHHSATTYDYLNKCFNFSEHVQSFEEWMDEQLRAAENDDKS